jgi:hypothetical protein
MYILVKKRLKSTRTAAGIPLKSVTGISDTKIYIVTVTLKCLVRQQKCVSPGEHFDTYLMGEGGSLDKFKRGSTRDRILVSSLKLVFL